MATASIIDEATDRVQEAVRSVEDGFEKLQKRVNARRKQLEKDTQKRVKRFRTELKKSSLVKRAESFQKDATRQIENAFESVLGGMQIATRADVAKIDRKLNALSKKLRELEKQAAQSA